MGVGEKIRNARMKAGLSQNELARTLGVSQTAVFRWENGERKPKPQQILKIAKVLDIPVNELDPELYQQLNNINNTTSYVKNNISCVGKNIKKYRLQKRMTQKDLADKLGVTQAVIAQFESEESNLRIKTISRIADALAIEPYKLLCNTSEQSKWIPICREVTPKNGQRVMLSFIDFPFVLFGVYQEDEEGGAFYYGLGQNFIDQNLFVSAWQPAPEPYKEDEE